MNTVIFLFRVSRRIRPAETYRKRLSSIFRYLSEMRKRLFSPCVADWILTCFLNVKILTQSDDSAKAIGFARWPIFEIVSFLEYLAFFRVAFSTEQL